MFHLKGKKALITGSTQGIGLAIAKAFVEHGAEVIVHCAEDLKKAQLVAGKIGASKGVVFDLRTCNYSELYKQTSDIDILVLNASVQFRSKWNEIDDSELEKQLIVNLKSSYSLIRLYEPYMEKNAWGRILTIGSVQQHKPHPDMAIYAATKAAVMNIVTNLAKQLAVKGITVNNLSPGVIATPRNDLALSDKAYSEKILEQIPMRRIGTAEDCVGAALLLCSDAGSYINGIDLTVDGGMKL